MPLPKLPSLSNLPKVKIFKGFTSRLNIENPYYVNYLRRRHLPFSLNPFKLDDKEPPRIGHRHRRMSGEVSLLSTDGADDWDDIPVGQRPPAWVEIAGDLVWTTTFSSLTNNSEITDSQSVGSYAVFFMLVWQMWATQTIYAVKFYTHDWLHRIIFALQLLLYGGLSAFTSDFDVFFFTNGGEGGVFVEGETPLNAAAKAHDVSRSTQLSFMGVSCALALHRLILLILYLRVTYYRYRTEGTSTARQHLYVPIITFISVLVYFMCYGIQGRYWSSGSTKAQFVLWGFTAVAEGLAYALTPDDDKYSLRGHGSLTERFSTLTVIIIGEGLNGFCGTLSNVVNAVGNGSQTVGTVFASGLSFFFLFVLYFETFWQRLPPAKWSRDLWAGLHLPFHLLVILFLEGLKNSVLFIYISFSLSVFEDKLLVELDKLWVEKPSVEFDHLLRKVGMSWEDEVNTLEQLFNSGASEDTVMLQYLRFLATVFKKIVSQFSEADNEEADYVYDTYMKDDSVVQSDITNEYPEWISLLLFDLIEPTSGTAQWIIPVAGLITFLLGIMQWVQTRPRDKYMWGMTLSKVLAGCLLLALSRVGINAGHQYSYQKMLPLVPVIVVIWGVTWVIDLVLTALSVREAILLGVDPNEPVDILEDQGRNNGALGTPDEKDDAFPDEPRRKGSVPVDGTRHTYRLPASRQDSTSKSPISASPERIPTPLPAEIN